MPGEADQTNESRKSILGNSILHLLPLFREWAIEANGKFLSDIEDSINLIHELFEAEIDNVIKKLVKVIKKLSLIEKEGFNPQYFFKNSNSLEIILESEDKKQTKILLELNSEKEKRQKDLRYYKPDEYSLDGVKYKKIKYWNDLFVNLVELYAKNNKLDEGNLDFIDSGTRNLLLKNPDESEKKLRKKLRNDLWLLTNFNSQYLSRFCFDLAKEMKLNLVIRLRPTRFRIERKYKRSKRIN